MVLRDLWLEVIEEMKERREKGLKSYGVPVTGEEEVDWLQHLLEELLDAVVYIKARQVQATNEKANRVQE